MKKITKSLAALAICGALNFGLTGDALAADVELVNPSEAEYQDVYRPSRRYRDDEYRRHYPPGWGAPAPSRRSRHRITPAPPPPGWGAPPPGRGATPPPMPPPPRR